MAFQNTFSGKGIAPVLPSGDGLQRSQESVSNLVLQAEKLKADTYRKNEEEFLKASNVDPVFVLANAARETQSKLLDTFNANWGKKMKERGGVLTTDDKVQMAKEKDYILMEQAKMKSSMDQYMAAKDAVQKDIQGNLDHDEFERRQADFFSTGNWDSSPLMPSAIDPDTYYEKNKINGTKGTITIQKKDNKGNVITDTVKASATEDEARERVKNDLLGNDRMARGFIEKFSLLKETDPETYKRYLDINKDGVVSPQEEAASKKRMVENPILQWAQDTYWDKTLDKEVIKKEAPEAKTGTTFNWNMAIGPGHNRNNDFAIKPGFEIMTDEGKTTLPDSYDFSGITRTTTDPRKINTVLKPDGKGGYTEIPLGESARYDLVSYSPSSDIAIINLKDDTSDGTYSSGVNLAVRGSDVDDLLRRKPFGIDRESLLKKATPTVTTKKKAY